MKRITGLIGRDELVTEVAREIRKGKHVLLTGPTGIGKSRVLEAAIKRIEQRQDELIQAGLELTNPIIPPTNITERCKERPLCVVYLKDHQAKGQFVALSKRLLEAGIIKPSALGLPKRMDSAPTALALSPLYSPFAAVKVVLSQLAESSTLTACACGESTGEKRERAVEPLADYKPSSLTYHV
jgi:energy-coupling factor transporter ATP-binding protein EcfA2